MLTLLGLILAIGIVVDDAIVVVENVDRIMHAEHLPPKEATAKAMQNLGSALVAMSLVLCAVFVPVSFLPGNNRTALQAVYSDDCSFCGDFHRGGSDLVAGDVRETS